MHEFMAMDREKMRGLGMWDIGKPKGGGNRILAFRIEGPFRVQSIQASMSCIDWMDCEDGYLALHTNGAPYPMPKDKYDENYDTVAKITGKALFNEESHA